MHLGEVFLLCRISSHFPNVFSLVHTHKCAHTVTCTYTCTYAYVLTHAHTPHLGVVERPQAWRLVPHWGVTRSLLERWRTPRSAWQGGRSALSVSGMFVLRALAASHAAHTGSRYTRGVALGPGGPSPGHLACSRLPGLVSEAGLLRLMLCGRREGHTEVKLTGMSKASPSPAPCSQNSPGRDLHSRRSPPAPL